MAAAGVESIAEAAAHADRVAEFVDAPLPGLTLFVQCRWSAGLPLRLPPGGADSVLCTLLACDGNRCWEGSLRRRDLAGPLGESWGEPSNLRLLLDALAARSISSSAGEGVLPTSEATWTCLDAGKLAPLELAIRFVYREGPVVAVRGVSLAPGGLTAGLSRFFDIAYGAQTAARAFTSIATDEHAVLLQREADLRRQIDSLPLEKQAEDDRLLKEMMVILNNQKQRCLKLWQDNRKAMGGSSAASPLGVPEKATASLEECLERFDELDAVGGPDQHDDDDDLARPTPFGASGTDDGMSLVFATQPPSMIQASASKHLADGSARASNFTFTIPLTLGMGDGPAFKVSQPDSAGLESSLRTSASVVPSVPAVRKIAPPTQAIDPANLVKRPKLELM